MTTMEPSSLNGDGTSNQPSVTNGHTHSSSSKLDVYSVPDEARSIFWDGIINNPLIKNNLPHGIEHAAQQVTFDGSPHPSIPICWRLAESVSALKAYEAAVLNVLLERKYGLDPVDLKINTDHAQLFFMSMMLWTIDPQGENLTAASALRPDLREKLSSVFPDCDKYRSAGSLYRTAATNIYKCKDGKYFHIHGGMNPNIILEQLGLPPNQGAKSLEESFVPFEALCSKMTSNELQEISDQAGQAGTICWTTNEYRDSEHGKANAHVGLFEIHSKPNKTQTPCWWPGSPSTDSKRPLAGLKVIDLTRIIAGPAVTRGLAELGASVMRITASHLPDVSSLHLDMNHGKWNATLDLRGEADRQKLKDLVTDADVFVQGYRPGVLDKYGFSQEDVLEMCKNRERGIIYVRENCYGWYGPWAGRSGWQQISDACCGVSMEFGRSMGNDEPVTPVFPNSDYCTGIIGTTAVMTALLRRAEEGGSFTIDLALNYYSQWLVNSVGTYPPTVLADVRKRAGNPIFRHHHHMTYTIPRVLGALLASGDSRARLQRPDFFTEYTAKNLDKRLRIVAPITRFPNGEVEPGYQVGTRTNGVDKPLWPADLGVEIVA